MLVDGFGQIGDGSWLFPHIAPEKFTKIVSVNIEQIVEDETIKKIYTIVQKLDPAYPEKMKLEYFRTFVICEKLNRNNSGNFEWMKIEDAVKSDKEHINILKSKTNIQYVNLNLCGN